jgi:Flp pilus assembly pilin Flp
MRPHPLPEYGYIVGFLACIVVAFVIALVAAALTGYQEK